MRGLTEKETALLDFDKLLKDIKNLKIQKSALIKEQDAQIAKNSKLVKDEIKLNEETRVKIEEANETARQIIEKAKSIERGINKKNSLASTKMSEALELERKAKDLIKSNEGLENNLSAEKGRVAELKKRLEGIKDSVIETLGG